MKSNISGYNNQCYGITVNLEFTHKRTMKGLYFDLAYQERVHCRFNLQ